MNGVEILNQYEELSNASTVLVIIFVMCAVLCTGTFVIELTYEEDKFKSIFCAVATFVFIACFVFTVVNGSRKTFYQVTISDDVSMKAFYEKYDVVNVEGKIYTVTEKEDK